MSAVFSSGVSFVRNSRPGTAPLVAPGGLQSFRSHPSKETKSPPSRTGQTLFERAEDLCSSVFLCGYERCPSGNLYGAR